MAEDRPSESTPGRLTRAGSDELEVSRAAQAGADFDWHFGRVTSLGTIEIANSRTVTILWEEGGISSQQGGLYRIRVRTGHKQRERVKTIGSKCSIVGEKTLYHDG